MSFALYDWQQVSAQDSLNSLIKHGVSVDCSDAGTGKTPKSCWQAVELLKAGLIKRVLVICPLAVVHQWTNWFITSGILPFAETPVNYEKLRTGKTPFVSFTSKLSPRKKIIKTWSWHLTEPTLVIYDEAHKLKGRDSLNGSIAKAFPLLHGDHKLLAMSATLARNPLEMDAIGYILGLHTSGNDFFKFCRKNGCQPAPWGHGLAYFGGIKRMTAIHHTIFPDKGTRISVKSLGDKFPKNNIFFETFDMEGVEEAYAEMEGRLLTLERTASGDADEDNPLTIRLRARQKIELLRLPAMRDFAIEQVLDTGRAAVIFLNFRESVYALTEMLSAHNPAVIMGGQTSEVRGASHTLFQSGQTNLIICQIQSGGVGIDLHDTIGVPRTSLISPTYSPTDYVQALGRICRSGSLSPAFQYVFYAAGTVEDEVRRNMERGRVNIGALNDGQLDATTKILNKHKGSNKPA